MIRYAIYALLVMAAIAAPAYASGLTATQSVQRMITIGSEDGTEQVAFVSAEAVTPGERVLYTISYANEGDDPAANVKLVMPVPAEVAYVENSARGDGARIAYSVDGGQTFSPRGDLTITVDGESRMALAEEITHIRWTFTDAIEPGVTGDVGYVGLLK